MKNDRAVAGAASRVRALLESEGPTTREEIVKRLKLDSTIFNGVGLWVDLVRVPPSGTWARRRADLYGLAEEWVGTKSSTVDGVELLVKRYLDAFGPARADDISAWAGLPVKQLTEVLEAMPLRTFVDEEGKTLYDVRGGTLPGHDLPAPVRFLPTWDATLLAHARRTQLISEEHRPLVFNTKTPHSVPTFLIDGHVAGSWRHSDGKVTLSPFEQIPRRWQSELRQETAALETFLNGPEWI
jgi:hypothetical protein